MENYKEVLAKLDFSNVLFEDLPVEVGEKVNEIIHRFWKFRDEIINTLPENIQIVYLVGEFESAILNDGLLSVFCNNNLNEILRFRNAVEKTNSKKLLKLFDEAKSLIEKKYTLKPNTSFTEEYPDNDFDEFLGEKISDKMEAIAEKVDDLQDSGEYWNRIENLF